MVRDTSEMKKKNLEKRLEEMRRAAEQGNVNAKQALKRISANCAR